MYHRFITNPTHREAKFKCYRNVVNDEIRKCKCDYYNNKFNNCRGNIHKTWKAINDVLKKSNGKKQCKTILYNGELTYDKNVIVNGFNEYFGTVGIKIADNLPSLNVDFNSFLNIM